MTLSDLAAGGFYVSSDVGGTFTDTVVVDASGELCRYRLAFTDWLSSQVAIAGRVMSS